MKYQCRTIKPHKSKWYEIDAPTWEEAANEFHTNHTLKEDGYILTVFPEENESGSGKYNVYFALIEVKDSEGNQYGPVVSRYFYHGIYRAGGVKPPSKMKSLQERLEYIAEKLGWEHPAEELLEEGWEGEE